VLRVHFLNVGHGDCTIIKHHSGRLTMIDINNSQDYDKDSSKEFWAEYDQKQRVQSLSLALSLSVSKNALRDIFEGMEKSKSELTDPVNFLQTQYPNQKLFRFILTHPDLDHMRGIKALHDKIGFYNFWDTDHTKSTPDFRDDDDKVDWAFYQSLRVGRVGLKPRHYTRGDCLFAFGKNEYEQVGGDNIEILSPTPELVRACNAASKSNSLSYVLRIFHAGKSILLPGDAEDDAWENMIDFYGSALKSDFLKASHHGRDTGYNLDVIKRISPLITFVSVGRKPDTDASSKYRQQCERVASTRYHGNIEVQIHDDGQHKWFVDRNPG